MKPPTFSICIPNYNYAQYIHETIQSVLNQTYPYFEIIVADNASSDDSIKVVESFNDPRIRLVRNRYNIGFAPNLQRVASFACNSFIIMLSSDDRMKPEALEKYARIVETQGDSEQGLMIYSPVQVIDRAGNQVVGQLVSQQQFYRKIKGEKKSTSQGLEYITYMGKDVLREAMRQLRTSGPFLSLAYSRCLFDAVEGYNSTHLTDPDTHFAYKLLGLNPQVVWIHEVLFEYRVHGSNQLALQSKQGSIKKPIDKYLYTIDISENQLVDLGLERKELVAAFVRNYLVDEMFHYLARGFYMQAYRGLAFALATYPGQTLRTPRAYLLAMLLLFGPFAGLVTKLVSIIYHNFWREN